MTKKTIKKSQFNFTIEPNELTGILSAVQAEAKKSSWKIVVGQMLPSTLRLWKGALRQRGMLVNSEEVVIELPFDPKSVTWFEQYKVIFETRYPNDRLVLRYVYDSKRELGLYHLTVQEGLVARESSKLYQSLNGWLWKETKFTTKAWIHLLSWWYQHPVEEIQKGLAKSYGDALVPSLRSLRQGGLSLKVYGEVQEALLRVDQQS